MMPSSFGCFSHQLCLGLLIAFAFHSFNVHSFQTITSIRPQLIQLHDSSSGDDVTAATNSEDDNAKISTQSITTMDDGGSDLTDRFKYKVSEWGTTLTYFLHANSQHCMTSLIEM